MILIVNKILLLYIIYINLGLTIINPSAAGARDQRVLHTATKTLQLIKFDIFSENPKA